MLVCGGREYNNREAVFRSLDRHHKEWPITLLIHGCATGADTLGGKWAEDRGVPVDPYPILPGESGYVRNGRMFFSTFPDMILFFPGGNGTKHMVSLAREHGCEVEGGLDTHPEPNPWLF